MSPVSKIKRGLLLFWTIYFGIVLLTNLCDGLKALKVLPQGWAFASGNYGLMIKVTRIYAIPPFLVALLFLAVCFWEAMATYFFWRAFAHYTGSGSAGHSSIYQAYGVALALWVAFIVADELLVVYELTGLEAAHLRLLTTQLVTLLAIELLPER